MKESELKKGKSAPALTPEELKMMWANISSQLLEIERQKKRKQLKGLSMIIILLSLAGFIGYQTLLRPDQYVAQERMEVTLRGGTKITLLKGATLRVEKSLLRKTRDVRLKGNAIFKVVKSKGHPFIVHGVDYDATVLGTVFKVSQSMGNFRVDLYEGKVAIKRNGDTAGVYVLHPYQSFNNYGNEKVVSISPIRKLSATSDQKKFQEQKSVHLQFTGCRLDDALWVVEKMYGIRVTYPDAYRENVISMNLDAMTGEDVLNNIALTLGLKVTKHENNYQLEK